MTKEEKLIDEFIKEYKALEEVINASDRYESVFDLEGKLEDSERRKLSSLRNMRNFIQHEKPFTLPSKETNGFLKDIVKRVADEEKIYVKDHMTKVKPVEESDRFKDSAKRLERTRVLPVVSKEGEVLGLFTNEVVRKAFNRGMTGKRIKDITGILDKKFLKEEELTLYSQLKEGTYVITKDNKYKGVLEKWI